MLHKLSIQCSHVLSNQLNAMPLQWNMVRNSSSEMQRNEALVVCPGKQHNCKELPNVKNIQNYFYASWCQFLITFVPTLSSSKGLDFKNVLVSNTSL